jgi:hypothetical protein
MDWGRGARSTMDRQWHGPKAPECGGAHWSMASGRSGARKLAGRGTTERGEHGELGSGLTGARAAVWRPGNGGEMTEERELGNRFRCT